MAKEYFWGAKLSEDQKKVTWDPDADMHDDEDEDDDDAVEHFLFLKQAVLGVEAKEGKRNIIEIETTNFDGDTVCQPLVSLKLGLNESVCLDIGLQPPVTFKLAVGSGPVYLSGQHALDLQENEDFREFREEDDEDLEDLDADESIVDVTPDLRKVIKGKAAAKAAKAAKKPAEDEDEDDEEDEDEEEEEEEEEEVKVAKGKKRPAPSAGGSAKKLAKTTEKDDTSVRKTITNGDVENGVAGEEHDDDDDEEDEDYKVEDEEEEDASEEEEEDEEMALGAGESDDEEESDEDEEDMEGEEDDEDDDDEEGEEEEEESSPDKSPKKTKKGKVNGVKKAEPAKVQGKTKGAKDKKKAVSMDEIKKSIMQSPSKPKKEEKFKNFVKSRFQVTEAKKIQELWGWFKSTQLK